MSLEITKKPEAEDGWPDLSSANQRVVSQTPRRLALEITRADRPGAADTSPPTQDDTAANALVQSDLPEVRQMAQEITGNETDPWKKALALQTWTARHMTFDAGIAVAPASELIRDRHGTCLGYSILLTTLARASGIPARFRVGYVYYNGIWGGHAWAEVFAQGQWRPLDAAVYYPGVADPARIAATTETGAAGVVGGVGELSKLYGKIEVRTLRYRLAGADVEVKPDAKDHTVREDAYDNPWLGLHVAKPAGMTFVNLDDHWPSSVVLAMSGPFGSAAIRLSAADPDMPLADEAGAVLPDILGGAPTGAPESVEWNGAPAVRFTHADRAVIAVRKDDELWIVSTSGPKAGALLDRILKGIVIDDPDGRRAASTGGGDHE